MKRLYVLLFFLTACGPKYPKHNLTTNQEFVPFIQSFENTFKINNKVAIVFSDLTNDHVGMCYRYTPNNTSNWIEIDKTYWGYLDNAGKEQLIYHELGHCVYGLNHNDEYVVKDNNYIEKSIMNSYHFGYMWYYSKYHDYYIQELKSYVH